ncbi:MAG: arsenate reductase ArsC, partial [Candidatus Puniceispirillaceae bacterium]
DNAAGETCPIWSGRPATAHWGLPDPAAVDGPQQAITAAFAATYDELVRRITQLLGHHPDATNIGALAQVMTSHEAS